VLLPSVISSVLSAQQRDLVLSAVCIYEGRHELAKRS